MDWEAWWTTVHGVAKSQHNWGNLARTHTHTHTPMCQRRSHFRTWELESTVRVTLQIRKPMFRVVEGLNQDATAGLDQVPNEPSSLPMGPHPFPRHIHLSWALEAPCTLTSLCFSCWSSDGFAWPISLPSLPWLRRVFLKICQFFFQFYWDIIDTQPCRNLRCTE